MRKELFILMLVVVGVIVGVLMAPVPQPAWRPKTQIVFLGFSNTVSGAPVTYMLFGFKGVRGEVKSFGVAEIDRQVEWGWKRWEPRPEQSLPPLVQTRTGFDATMIVPVPTISAPVRVVFQLEQWVSGYNMPRDGNASQLLWDLQVRWKQFRQPDNPSSWVPKGPIFYFTNEFNFAAGTNVAGKGETGR